MTNKAYMILAALTSLLLLLTGCGSDEPITPDTGTLRLECNQSELASSARYHTLRISGAPFGDGVAYTVATDAGWLRLEGDSLPHDGVVELWAEANPNTSRRTATLTVARADNPAVSGMLQLVQRGDGEDGDNGLLSDPLSDFRLGWGLNAFDEYQSSSSVRGRVIDLDRLASFDTEDGFQSVQEVVRARVGMTVDAATSLSEMSSILTQRFDQSVSFLGMSKTINRFKEVCTSEIGEQYCSYARMSKVVATRSVDAGALDYIVGNCPADKLPLTDNFRKVYDEICSPGCTDIDNKIQAMLDEYGTHVVIEASVGGMIDYVATFNRMQTSQVETVAEEQSMHVFGKKSGSVSKEVRESLTSDLSRSGSVEVKGGDSTLRKKIEERVKTLSQLDSIPSDLTQAWMSSIVYHRGNRNTLDLIDFRVVPIWNLFTDQSIAQKVMLHVVQMQEQSNNRLPDKDLGTDCYEIGITGSNFAFDNSDNRATSLVKVLYVSGVPTLEICQEYVPKIRSDRRITVIYPIYNGMASHSQGLFPGDGEGNRPASLAFHGSDAYVMPIDGKGSYDKLDRVYYIHGNLYAVSYGSVVYTPNNITVKPYYLQLSKQYPVVKIGDGYWTRCNIAENTMGFGYPVNPKNPNSKYHLKEFYDSSRDVLYACVFYGNSPQFLARNRDVYGFDVNETYGKRTKWCLPKEDDVQNLKKYLGNDPRIMFQGQASGFEADFAGSYGLWDDLKGTAYSAYGMHYIGKCCFIPCKNSENSKTGKVLILTDNYELKIADITVTQDNNYPLRLFRTSCWVYPNMK